MSAALGRRLNPHLVNGGRVEQLDAGENDRHYRLSIPPVTDAAYADAQLDDYAKSVPMQFANHPPQHLALRARFSHPQSQLKGTAGFGFWNHPFGQEGQLLAAPCNAWFFYGSAESNLRVKPHFAGHGFTAAVLQSPPIPSTQNPASRALLRGLDRLLQIKPISRLLMATAQQMVRADAQILDLDMTQWHTYEVIWDKRSTRFVVDGREVLRSVVSPAGPLGFVAWIDNYRAIAANSQYQFGYVACPYEQWMDLSI